MRACPRVRVQDIYTLFHLHRDFKFISKTSNFLIPIIGWSMFLTGAPASGAPAGRAGTGRGRGCCPQAHILAAWQQRRERHALGSRSKVRMGQARWRAYGLSGGKSCRVAGGADGKAK